MEEPRAPPQRVHRGTKLQKNRWKSAEREGKEECDFLSEETEVAWFMVNRFTEFSRGFVGGRKIGERKEGNWMEKIHD